MLQSPERLLWENQGRMELYRGQSEEMKKANLNWGVE